MPESVNALLNQAGRIAATPQSTVANLAAGAQLGYGPHLPQIDAATPLTFSPVVPVVLHSPTMFRNIPHADDVLKALVERQAKDISGIDFEYTLESSGTPAGHDGQQLMMPTASRRSPIQPQFTWPEVTGNLVWNFIRNWISMIRHPDTQASMTSILEQQGSLTPQLMSAFCMDVLFIQFDSTMRPENIIDAYIVTSMWPQQTGMLGTKRTIGEVTTQERSVTFHGILQHNTNTKRVGKRVADVLALHRIDYDVSVPVADQISKSLLGKGIEKEAAESIASFGDLGA